MKNSGVLESLLLVSVICSALLSGACRTEQPEVPVKRESLNREEQLNRIRHLYSPPACFYTRFQISVESKGESKKANGSLRVDNGRGRMKFVFTEPIFGITLSRVTVVGDRVRIENPHAPGNRQNVVIPIEQFQVRGLGGNHIVLPFRLFQDLLYARLPREIFAPESRVKKEASSLGITVNGGGEQTQYLFQGERLRKLVYERNQEPESVPVHVEVDLKGKYGKTMFPEEMAMTMKGERGLTERMRIVFRGVNLEARCDDSYFPWKGQ